MQLLDKVILRLRRSGKFKSVLDNGPDSLKESFQTIAEAAEMRRFYESTLVPADALEPKYRAALSLLREHLGPNVAMGDYLEFGVCHGTSMLCMHNALQRESVAGVRLFGFDSFDGLPEEANHDDEGAWRAGWFKSSYDLTRQRLDKSGIDWNRTKLVKGWFSDTCTDAFLSENAIKRASVIMIDCDMYLSAKQALTFCAPLIDDGTIFFFDDWDSGGKKRLSDNNLGERRAFNEFLDEHPELVAAELPDLRYRTSDPTSEAYSRCFVVARRSAVQSAAHANGSSRTGLAARLALALASAKVSLVPLVTYLVDYAPALAA
jgi:O-methyltransferase